LRRGSPGDSRTQNPSSGRNEPRDFGKIREDIFPIRVKTNMKQKCNILSEMKSKCTTWKESVASATVEHNIVDAVQVLLHLCAYL
jgi:hypothetical protein